MPPTASRALSHRIVFAWFSALIFSAALLPLPAHAASTLLNPPNNLGLVGYWSFDDGTSTQATDFSGNGNTGTLTTTGSTLPAWTSGKKGNALSFDGSSSYVTAGKISGLAGATKATISAWLYRASPNDPVALGQTDTGGSTTRFGVQWSSDNNSDESGQGNTGTLVGLTQQSTTAGHLGQALTFDGSSSYVVTPTAVLTTTPLTFSAWIYPTNTNADKFVVGVGSATGGSLNEIYMEASNSGQISVWQWANGSFSGNSGPSYAANVWQHVAGVVDASGNITIYLNGVPTSAGTISGSPSGLNKTAIGAFIHNDGSFSTNFAEKLDDVRIYNRALTATEVQHLYKLGSVTVRQN
jgi:hypothetical protein